MAYYPGAVLTPIPQTNGPSLPTDAKAISNLAVKMKEFLRKVRKEVGAGWTAEIGGFRVIERMVIVDGTVFYHLTYQARSIMSAGQVLPWG